MTQTKNINQKKKVKGKKIDMISFDWIDSTIRSFWYSYVVLVDTFQAASTKKAQTGNYIAICDKI